jgi:transmembrane sensor
MDRNELQQLAKKYLDGTASSEEKETLDKWYNTIHEDRVTTIVSEFSEGDVKHLIMEKIKGKMAVNTLL